LRARDSQSIKLFLPNRKTKYFWRRGWTPKSRDSPPGKSVGSIEAGSAIPVVGHQLTFGSVCPFITQIADIATLPRQVRLVPMPDGQVHVAVCTQMARLCSTKSGSVSISFMKMNGTDEMFFAFYGKRNPCAPVSPRALLASDFTRTYGGSDHVTGQASFEAETHNQSHRRKGAGRRRTEFFAGG
jgi:hypothetical protein